MPEIICSFNFPTPFLSLKAFHFVYSSSCSFLVARQDGRCPIHESLNKANQIFTFPQLNLVFQQNCHLLIFNNKTGGNSGICSALLMVLGTKRHMDVARRATLSSLSLLLLKVVGDFLLVLVSLAFPFANSVLSQPSFAVCWFSPFPRPMLGIAGRVHRAFQWPVCSNILTPARWQLHGPTCLSSVCCPHSQGFVS